jgi:hypothetical protein
VSTTPGVDDVCQRCDGRRLAPLLYSGLCGTCIPSRYFHEEVALGASVPALEVQNVRGMDRGALLDHLVG